MTPEERAVSMLNAWTHEPRFAEPGSDRTLSSLSSLLKLVTAEMEAAVAAECEACARLADGHRTHLPDGEALAFTGEVRAAALAALQIAAAIRARGTP